MAQITTGLRIAAPGARFCPCETTFDYGMTQFGPARQDLNIDIICANSGWI